MFACGFLRGIRKPVNCLLIRVNVCAGFTKVYKNLDNSQTTYISLDRKITKRPTLSKLS